MAVRGDTQVALMEITIKNRRWTRTMKMKSWDNRVAKKSFAEILAPKKDAGQPFSHDHGGKAHVALQSRISARK